jgi:hypothetical protein
MTCFDNAFVRDKQNAFGAEITPKLAYPFQVSLPKMTRVRGW